MGVHAFRVFSGRGKSPSGISRRIFPRMKSGDIPRRNRRPDGVLEVSYQIYDSDAFGFGSGFTGSPEPPTRFLYPLRKISFGSLSSAWCSISSCPGRSIVPGHLLSDLRVILGDFASMILFVPFFGIPIFVIGARSRRH